MAIVRRVRVLLSSLCLTALFAALAGAAFGQQTNFTVLTYNVAGLPPGVAAMSSGLDVLTTIPLIADRLTSASYDIIAMQEGFVHGFDDPNQTNGVGTQFYDELTTMNATPLDFSFPPSDVPTGGATSVASGLIRLSTSTFTSYSRTRWNMLFGAGFPTFENGSDEGSDKGFSFARHEVAPGMSVDVYNLHADAGQDAGSMAARADNISQLITAINANSPATNAVIVMGDTNSLYTRSTDVIRSLIEAGTINDPLTDVWVQLARSGSVPAIGPELTSGCATSLADADCEDVDKIFYRGGTSVPLVATAYFVEDDFLDGNMDDLSDHFPTGAVFTVPEPAGASLAALLALVVLARRRSQGLV